VREDYVIVDPGPDDADEIGHVHVLVWQQAYAGLMPSEYLAALDPDQRAAQWRGRLSCASSRGAGGDEPVDQNRSPRTRAARHRGTGELVGIGTAGPARDVDPPVPAELWMLNVLKTHHGSGVAELLVDATLGDGPAYLWVLAGNERAQAFYRRLGFVADGVTKVLEDTGNVELRMVRRGG
jgi:ribosomal protein S18 acetylase RimI-like enzyme